MTYLERQLESELRLTKLIREARRRARQAKRYEIRLRAEGRAAAYETALRIVRRIA